MMFAKTVIRIFNLGGGVFYAYSDDCKIVEMTHALRRFIEGKVGSAYRIIDIHPTKKGIYVKTKINNLEVFNSTKQLEIIVDERFYMDFEFHKSRCIQHGCIEYFFGESVESNDDLFIRWVCIQGDEDKIPLRIQRDTILRDHEVVDVVPFQGGVFVKIAGKRLKYECPICKENQKV